MTNSEQEGSREEMLRRGFLRINRTLPSGFGCSAKAEDTSREAQLFTEL